MRVEMKRQRKPWDWKDKDERGPFFQPSEHWGIVEQNGLIRRSTCKDLQLDGDHVLLATKVDEGMKDGEPRDKERWC